VSHAQSWVGAAEVVDRGNPSQTVVQKYFFGRSARHSCTIFYQLQFQQPGVLTAAHHPQKPVGALSTADCQGNVCMVRMMCVEQMGPLPSANVPQFRFSFFKEWKFQHLDASSKWVLCSCRHMKFCKTPLLEMNSAFAPVNIRKDLCQHCIMLSNSANFLSILRCGCVVSSATSGLQQGVNFC